MMKPENKKYTLIAIFLIVIVGFAVYANSLGGEFIWDDIAFVKDNEFIRSWDNATRLFTKDAAKSLAPGGGGVKYNFFRPLQILTLMADYSLWGLNPVGYHFTNTIFHILAGLAIFWLITILFDDWILALFTGALFVAHPIHTEAVAFISGRADPMAFAFIILTLIFYIKSLNSKKPIFYILTLLGYVLAVLSREISVILPALLLLYHFSFRKKIKLAPCVPIVAVTAGYILLRSAMASRLLSGENIPSFSGALHRIPGFFVAITAYFRMLFLPFNLHMEYGKALFKFSDPEAILGAVIFVGLLAYAFKEKNRNKLASFGILWFFIALLPQSNIYPVGAYMAEHWLYLPSVGFFLLLARGLKSLRWPLIILLVFYSFLTIKQNTYWRELIPFYEKTLKYNSESPRLLNNLGVAYHNNKEYSKAVGAYKKSIEFGPTYFETHSNLGAVYHDIKEYEKAEAMYKKEIAMNPAYPKAHNNLGALYSDTGEYKKAIGAYKKSIEIRPARMEMYFNLGLAYQNAGKYKEAIRAYLKAIELNPNYPNAYHDLGVTYHKTGEYEKAIAAYKRAIKLNPNSEEMYTNLAMANEALGKAEDAIYAYKRAIRINPGHASAHNNLAILYFRTKRYSLAAKHCDKALRLGHEVSPQFLNDLKPHRK
ncbi:MAG: tetratricopeptide repeat protein [Omnitrophica bacterium]|nr:tetratricopeptide repeat protein [Candidatus Omnitrophota bacterium]